MKRPASSAYRQIAPPPPAPPPVVPLPDENGPQVRAQIKAAQRAAINRIGFKNTLLTALGGDRQTVSAPGKVLLGQ